MLFSVLVLIGFGAIVYVCATLWVRSIIRNKNYLKYQSDHKDDKFNCTPQHLRPHFVEKPKNFNTLIKDESLSDNKAVNQKLNSNMFMNQGLMQAAQAFRNPPAEPNFFVEETSHANDDFTNKEFMPEEKLASTQVPRLSDLPVENKQDSTQSDDYGFSIHHTIPIKSKSDVLKYLDSLKTLQGEKIYYVKTEVLEGPDPYHPIEEYKISLHGKAIAKLYFILNTIINAKRIPRGFTF